MGGGRKLWGNGGRVWESDARGIMENRPPLRHGAVSREGARDFLATKQPCTLVRKFEKF
jgi:hypothetical protein